MCGLALCFTFPLPPDLGLHCPGGLSTGMGPAWSRLHSIVSVDNLWRSYEGCMGNLDLMRYIVHNLHIGPDCHVAAD